MKSIQTSKGEMKADVKTEEKRRKGERALIKHVNYNKRSFLLFFLMWLRASEDQSNNLADYFSYLPCRLLMR